MRTPKARLAVALLCAALAACGKADDDPIPGYAEGEYVRVAAPLAGTLTDLKVQRGAQVNAGDPLFVLEQENEAAAQREAAQRAAGADAQLADLRKGKRVEEIAVIEQQLAQAQATLTASEDELRRTRQLIAENFVSHERLVQAQAVRDRDAARVRELKAQVQTARLPARNDEIRAAEAEANAARAALAQAQWRLDQKAVRAGETALVTDTLYVEGEWVNTGAPVVALLPPQNIKLRFFVSETRLGALKVGQPVEVRCDGCGDPIPAQISYISPRAEYTPPVIYSRENREKLVFMIEARPTPEDATRLHPGQPVEVHLAGR
ncbi:MAG TPA: HlyD family efflux transporter periplasmic adaptor subunit [Burkholderiales bacterium]|nr:HlyD family efflux transporter periplasmic adaptor subunit [Burkholderiales bacterium]